MKYCFAFIRGQKCSNPDCLYLHHLAPKEDCFTKEEMTTRQHEFYQLTHPGNGSSWDEHQQVRVSGEFHPEVRVSSALGGIRHLAAAAATVAETAGGGAEGWECCGRFT